MNLKGLFVMGSLVIAAVLLLGACSSPDTTGGTEQVCPECPEAEPQIVKETVIVTVEVPGAAAAATPQVTIEVAPGTGTTFAFSRN